MSSLIVCGDESAYSVDKTFCADWPGLGSSAYHPLKRVPDKGVSGAELQDGVVDLPVVLGHHEAAQAVGGGLLVPRRRWLGRDHVTVEVSAAEPVEQDQPNPWQGVKRLH